MCTASSTSENYLFCYELVLSERNKAFLYFSFFTMKSKERIILIKSALCLSCISRINPAEEQIVGANCGCLKAIIL